MSKKIKQDYEEQKRQAAENNSINQIETFHAESMTMEAHKSKHLEKKTEKRSTIESRVTGSSPIDKSLIGEEQHPRKVTSR
jgi:hypothetical protein